MAMIITIEGNEKKKSVETLINQDRIIMMMLVTAEICNARDYVMCNIEKQGRR